MPLVFCKPSAERSSSVAEREERPYWSAAGHLWLRKWGLVHLTWEEGMPSVDGFDIVARGTHRYPSSDGAFWEGPIPPEVLAQHGVRAEARSTQSMRLLLPGVPLTVAPGVWPLSDFGRPVELLRRIPRRRGDISWPYVLPPGEDAPIAQLRYQRLRPPDGWRVLAWAREAGDPGQHPVVVSNGRCALSGLPILDLCVEKMSMPDCPDGYYAPVRAGIGWRAERWLTNLLVGHAIASGVTVVRLRHWPGRHRAAFTVRHDYDRAIPDDNMDRLLRAYRRPGVRCSVGFLRRLMPDQQIRSLKRDGHEIVLHSEAADVEGLRTELADLGRQANTRITGVTCHGGIGSAGHLGGTLFRWCARSGVDYTEQLGRDHLIPHPALVADGSQPQRIDCMVMSGHHSLDSGTAPHAHAFPCLVQDIPLLLAAGGVVNLMNHPDIHVRHLLRLVDSLDLRDAWCATHAQIIDWCRLTKYDSNWSHIPGVLRIAFGQPLPYPLQAEILSPVRAAVAVIPAGTEQTEISTNPTNYPNAHTMPSLFCTMDRNLERLAAGFRNPTPAVEPPADEKRVQEGSFDRAAKQRPSPRATRIEQPQRAALVVRSLKESSAAIARLRSIKGVFRYPPQEIYLFSLSGGTVGLPDRRDAAASFFHTYTPGLFQLALVDSNVRLFDTPFGADFVKRVSQLVCSDGILVLPDWEAQHPKSGIRPGRLGELLGADGRPLPGPGFLCFPGPFAAEGAPSVLGWYLRQSAEVLLQELAFRNGGFDLRRLVDDPIVGEFLVAGELVSDRVRGARGRGIGEDLQSIIDDTVASHAYLISGISYKAALIAHIIAKAMPGRAGLGYADIGGGFGALGAELLVASSPDLFFRVITRDIASQNVLLARNLYSGLYGRLAGRFRFSLGPAETFPFEEGYDVISFVGSLLYVDKRELPEVVHRAWAAVRPGGLLIVHENIKTPTFARDFDLMFEAAELNALLGRYGDVRCFLSTAYVELSPEAAANRTVFRVLQKPATA